MKLINLHKIISLTRVNTSGLFFLGTRFRYPVSLNRCYSNEVGIAEESSPGLALAPLIDAHGRRHDYLRISLTERCNLRCQYCMPAEGVPLSARSALLSTEEVVRLARVFVSCGVNKVRLTGGEPTLRRDLPHIIQQLGALGVRTVALTTNGLVLTRRLPELQRAGLTALNVSLDSLRADRYERMARRPALSRVLAGIDLALQLGYSPVKINVVLMKGFNDDEIGDFVEYTRDRDVEVRFIEFMPFSGNKWDDSKLVSYRSALRALLKRHPEAQPAPPRPNDTARVWRVAGYRGSVGFISSMTQHFCGACNRLRLTADGNLKVCLFGAAEVSLRDRLRAGDTDARIEQAVRAALLNKKPKHAARGAAWVGAASAAWVGGAGWVGAARVGARAYCSQAGSESERGAFSHLDSSGRARMVDVGDKPVTLRTATAECGLVAGGRLLRLLRDARLPKGDALTVAEVAGALAAKRTHHLLPMCHALPLSGVRVRVQLPAGDALPAAGGTLRVSCTARAEARTGVEMEALTGCAVAALALYDMCKSVDRDMRITDLRVVHKAGGKSDYPPPAPRAPPAAAERPRRAADAADAGAETYAPTDLAHF